MNIGICGCGCGRKTKLATETRPRRGWIAGTPKPFLPHHSKYRRVSKDGVHKKCAECSRRKHIDQFYRFEASPDGRQRICKACSAEQAQRYRTSPNGRARVLKASLVFNLRSHFGLTQKTYMAMHTAQSGLCAICKKPESASRLGTTRRLGVDHDHVTNEVRELLCEACNHGIGKFRDDPELLEAAAAYLRKHRSR
jgi:hypothetical protein